MSTDVLEPPPAQEIAGPSRTVQAIEVAILILLMAPAAVTSFSVIDVEHVSFAVVASATIVRDLSLVSLLLYFLWRNGEPFTLIGWTSRHVLRDVLIGAALFVPMFFCAAALELVLQRAGLGTGSRSLRTSLSFHGPLELVLAVLLVITAAVVEETIFRGYLLLRLPAILRNMPAAVVLSAILFACGHGYEGIGGMVDVGFIGLILALVYLWRKSLVAPMVMHFLQDFIALVLVPLLMGG